MEKIDNSSKSLLFIPIALLLILFITVPILLLSSVRSSTSLTFHYDSNTISEPDGIDLLVITSKNNFNVNQGNGSQWQPLLPNSSVAHQEISKEEDGLVTVQFTRIVPSSFRLLFDYTNKDTTSATQKNLLSNERYIISQTGVGVLELTREKSLFRILVVEHSFYFIFVILANMLCMVLLIRPNKKEILLLGIIELLYIALYHGLLVSYNLLDTALAPLFLIVLILIVTFFIRYSLIHIALRDEESNRKILLTTINHLITAVLSCILFIPLLL